MYYVLNELPIWFLALMLDVLCIDILFLGREKLEGLAYNVAFSSQYGDRALIGCVLIGASIIHRQEVVPHFLGSGLFQFICAILAILSGHLVQIVLKSRQTMDVYHNAIIVPIFLASLAAALPMTYLYGSAVEKISTVALFGVWVFLLVYDAVEGRLDQRKWLAKRKVTWVTWG